MNRTIVNGIESYWPVDETAKKGIHETYSRDGRDVIFTIDYPFDIAQSLP